LHWFKGSIVLNEGLQKIGEYAFGKHHNLRKVVFNNGIQRIGIRAFFDCASLESINIPSTVLEIEEYSFSGCSDVRMLVLRDGLKKIGAKAFDKCLSLERITIPSTVEEIGNYAFDSCNSLREVVLNDRNNKIKQGVFAKCTSLECITIPSTVIEIGAQAFNTCCGLREVVIHNSETQIDDKSFTNCTLLERFKFPSLSTRLNYVIKAGQRGIEAKMDNIPAVEWRGGELIIPDVRRRYESTGGIPLGIIVEVDEEKLDKVKGLIAYYEMKEATTLFELALWKARIDQADISSSADRPACRVEVPGPVKDAILQYVR